MLVSTTIREGGARAGWSDVEISKGAAAWLQQQVTEHLARLLEKKIDVKDEESPWGAWWLAAYDLRNEAVHDGKRIAPADVVKAKRATAVVLRQLRADLEANEWLVDLAKALRVDFADDEHDYKWKIVQVMPWSIRRAERAQRRLDRLMP